MGEKQVRNWVVFCHLGGLIPICFLNVVIPWIIWLTQKSESSFIDEQGKEIINFQISLTIYSIALSFIAWTTIAASTIVGYSIACLGWIVLIVLNIIFIIKGAIKASKGEKFLYPINLRLIK